MKLKGIPYFPYPSANDDNLKLLIAKFRLKGIAIYLTLTQKIYAYNGYYYTISDDIISLLRQELNLGATDKIISDIIDFCVNNGIWSKEKYEAYSILTSEEIQKEYLNAVRKRKNIVSFLNKDYLLGFALEFYKKAEENSKTAEEPQKTAEELDKEKKRKENQTKLNEKKENEEIPADEDTPTPFEGDSLSSDIKLEKFKSAFPDIYTGDVKYIKEEVNIDSLILALQESPWARNNMTLKTCLKHYDKLVNGGYKTVTISQNASNKAYTHSYTNTELNNLFKRGEDLDT